MNTPTLITIITNTFGNKNPTSSQTQKQISQISKNKLIESYSKDETF